MLLPGNLGFWYLPAKQCLYRATNIPETILSFPFIGRRRTAQSSQDVEAVLGGQLHSQGCLPLWLRLLQLPFFFFIASHVEAVLVAVAVSNLCVEEHSIGYAQAPLAEVLGASVPLLFWQAWHAGTVWTELPRCQGGAW